MSRRHLIAPVFVMLFLFCSESNGALITPPGLNPGDQFRLIFVTSTKIEPTYTDVAVYDDHVRDAAIAAGLSIINGNPVTWEAVVSVGTQPSTVHVNAIDRLPSTHAPIYNLAPSPELVKAVDIWDGTALANSVLYNENRVAATLDDTYGSSVWTGTISDGMAYTGGVDPFFLGVEGGLFVGVGLFDATTSSWIDASSAPSPYNLPLYGISNVLQVPFDTPVIPEPGTMVLGLIGLAGMIGARWAKRLRQGRR